MNKIVQYTIIFLFSLARLLPLYSEYTISSTTISSGGIIGCSNGNNITLSSTVGETVIGNSENGTAEIQLFAGFWNTYQLGGSSDIGETEVFPYKYELSQNYPNPFNPTTTINYELQKDNIVTLAIYNIKGELVENVVNNKMMQMGKHSISFDGSRLSSGYYFYRFTVGTNGKDFTSIKKMIMVK